MITFIQSLSGQIQALTSLLHDALMPLLKELTFDAVVVAGLLQAWRKVSRRRRTPPKPPPKGGCVRKLPRAPKPILQASSEASRSTQRISNSAPKAPGVGADGSRVGNAASTERSPE